MIKLNFPDYQYSIKRTPLDYILDKKFLINQMIGPWVDPGELTPPGAGATAQELQAHNNYVAQLQTLAAGNGGFARNTDASSPWPNGRGIPTNITNVSSTPCSTSFRNLLKDDAGNTLVAVHQTLWYHFAG